MSLRKETRESLKGTFFLFVLLVIAMACWSGPLCISFRIAIALGVDPNAYWIAYPYLTLNLAFIVTLLHILNKKYMELSGKQLAKEVLRLSLGFVALSVSIGLVALFGPRPGTYVSFPWNASPSFAEVFVFSLTFSISIFPWLLVGLIVIFGDDARMLKTWVLLLTSLYNWTRIQIVGEPAVTQKLHRHDESYYFLVLIGAVALTVPLILYSISQLVRDEIFLNLPSSTNSFFNPHELILWFGILLVELSFLASCIADTLGIVRGGLAWDITIKPLSLYFLLSVLLLISSVPQVATGLAVIVIMSVSAAFGYLLRLAMLIIPRYKAQLRDEVLNSFDLT